MHKRGILPTLPGNGCLYLALLIPPLLGDTQAGIDAAQEWNRHFACGEQQNKGGHLAQAEDCYRSALLVAERVSDNLLRGKALTGLGRTMLEQGRISEAGDALTEAVAKLRKDNSKDSNLYLARALLNLATYYSQQNRLFEAEEHLHQSMTLLIRGGAPKVQIADVLVSLGWVEIYRRRPGAAESYFKRALATLGETENTQALAAVYNSISAALAESNRPHEALKAAQNALAAAKASPAITPSELVSHACAVARTSLKTGDYGVAEQTLIYAQEVLGGSAQRELGPILATFADLRYLQGRYEEAADFEHGALAILRLHLSPDHAQLIRLKANYIQVLRKLHRTAEAKQVEREFRDAQRQRANDPGEKFKISAADLRRK